MIRFVQAYRRHRLRHDDSGSAMLMSLLFTVFAAGIMLVLLAVLLSQAQASGVAQKNTRTGYAAQSGIQASLSIIRSHTTTVTTDAGVATVGDPTKLPSTLAGTVDGAVDSDLKYEVSLAYYTQDPSGRDDSWLAANALAWPLSSDPQQQPRFVRIASEGIDAGVKGVAEDVGDRTIVALYAFTTTNVNSLGGMIRTFDGNRCLRADSVSVGSAITVTDAVNCSSSDDRSLWVYGADWQLKLASTVNVAGIVPLCITGQQWVGTPSGTNLSQANATLHPCAATNAAAYGNQLWSWDDPGSWEAQRRDNTPVPRVGVPEPTAKSGRWLGVASTLPGAKLVERIAKVRSFAPDASVGAGAASYLTTQIVNFAEFGRCMDITGNTTTAQYMIVFPCKQDPTGSGVEINWNHKWHYAEPAGGAAASAPQALWIEDGRNRMQKMCLTTRPASTGNPDLHFINCNNPTNATSLTAAQRFIRNGNTGDATTSYTFQLAADPSKCLAAVPIPVVASDINSKWSRLRIMPCNGSAAQKWNAPPLTSGSVLGGYKEIG